MLEFLQSIEWTSPATWSALLGWVVALMTVVVAPVARLTPNKRDDAAVARILGVLERFSLVAFSRRKPDAPGKS